MPGHEWFGAGKFAYEWLPDSSRADQPVRGDHQQASIDLVQRSGLSGSVYTEPTDVEDELNGFFTYDRQVQKMDFARVREVHLRVLGAANGTTLSLNKLSSLRVTTPGYTDRYLRHRDGVARTDVISAGSAVGDKQDATF